MSGKAADQFVPFAPELNHTGNIVLLWGHDTYLKDCVAHNGLDRTFRDADQATPAPAHIDKRRFITVNRANGVAPTYLFCAALGANKAAVIVHFQYDGAARCSCVHKIDLYTLQIRTAM